MPGNEDTKVPNGSNAISKDSQISPVNIEISTA
jgi:hypothetical protein